MTAGDFKQSGNLNGKILASGQIASASTDTTIHTVAGSTAEKIATMVVYNSDTSSGTVEIYVVPSGGSIGASTVIANFTLAASDTTVITEIKDVYLEAGAVIAMNVSSAGKINYLVSGVVSS